MTAVRVHAAGGTGLVARSRRATTCCSSPSTRSGPIASAPTGLPRRAYPRARPTRSRRARVRATPWRTCPVTLPSHSSIFTGKYPTRHGVHDNGTYPARATAHETLAEALRQGCRATTRQPSWEPTCPGCTLRTRARASTIYDDYYGEKARRSRASRSSNAEPMPSWSPRKSEWLVSTRTAKPWFAWVHRVRPACALRSARALSIAIHGDELLMTAKSPTSITC